MPSGAMPAVLLPQGMDDADVDRDIDADDESTAAASVSVGGDRSALRVGNVAAPVQNANQSGEARSGTPPQSPTPSRSGHGRTSAPSSSRPTAAALHVPPSGRPPQSPSITEKSKEKMAGADGISLFAARSSAIAGHGV